MSRPNMILLSLALSVLGCALEVPPPPPEPPVPQQLELASTEWPPFTAPTGEARVASELVAKALASDRIDTKESIVPEKGWLESIRAGEYDGSAAVWWSEDRASYLVFSEPYLENRLVLVGRRDADLTATSLTELGGKRIGLVEGYAYGEDIDALEARAAESSAADTPIFVREPSTPANVRALLAGELDYVLADALFAHYSLVTHPQREELAVGEAAIVTRSLHFAVRKDLPEAEALVANFDARMRQMLRDGSYNDILGFGWIEADVNGDGVPDFIFQGEHAGPEAPSGHYRVRTPEQERPSVEVQPDYIINGQTYDSWDAVPDSFKTPGVGGSNVGIGIRW